MTTLDEIKRTRVHDRHRVLSMSAYPELRLL